MERASPDAPDPSGPGPSAARPPHRGAALSLRRGQEPLRRQPGQAVTLALDLRQRSPVYLRGPHAPLRRFARRTRSEEHTSELQSPMYLVCRLLLEKKKKIK